MHLYILFLVRMFSLHLIRSDLHVVFVWPQKKKKRKLSPFIVVGLSPFIVVGL